MTYIAHYEGCHDIYIEAGSMAEAMEMVEPTIEEDCCGLDNEYSSRTCKLIRVEEE